MITNELYLKILPGKKLNTLEKLGEGIFIDAILCDSDNTKIAALSKDYSITGLDKANVTSDTTTNIYAADDSHTVEITTPVVQGMFKEVYVDTTSEPVRVHITRG
jgi:hypothetical protein